MSEKKKIFTVVIGDGAYTKERPYTMLRFAYTALLDDHKINIFLVEDGIFVGKKNQYSKFKIEITNEVIANLLVRFVFVDADSGCVCSISAMIIAD